MSDSDAFFELECDVPVAGSGSAGLTAALAAAARGARVIIAEKTSYIDGTTALWGAAIWAPANHVAAAAGVTDSAAEALAYLHAAAPEGWAETEAPLWARMAESAGPMLRFVEDHTPLSFELTPQPDPLAALPGAKPLGRMVSPRVPSRKRAGTFRHCLRPALFPHLYSFREAVTLDLYHRPIRAAFRLAPSLLCRLLTNRRGKGTALVVGLLRGCLVHEARIFNEMPLEQLTQADDGRVTGAIARHKGRPVTIRARQSVILASGGFEWDEVRRAQHFPGPIGGVASPRGNSGDAHRMAEAVGAALAQMDQANFAPVVPRATKIGRTGSPCISTTNRNLFLVDGTGRRFTDDTLFNLGEVMDKRGYASPVRCCMRQSG